jgi:CRISPR/Cas system-associated endonuclease/helicase Cas3
MPKVKKSSEKPKKVAAKAISIEDVIDEDFCPEDSFAIDLERIYERFVTQKSSELEAIQSILSATNTYFEYRAWTEENGRLSRVEDIFTLLNRTLIWPYFQQKRAKELDNMALGGFVQILIHYGMPRLPAIVVNPHLGVRV